MMKSKPGKGNVRARGDTADRFPPQRAFVVQLSASEDRTYPTSGRVEHVLSGRSIRFDTMEQLSQFFGKIIASEEGAEEGSRPRWSQKSEKG